MTFWVSQIFNGISYGALLFLLAGGLTLIFGAMNIINVAHGSFYLIGGYIGFEVIRLTGNFYIGILAAGIFVGILGLIIEPVFFESYHHERLDGFDAAVFLTDLGSDAAHSCPVLRGARACGLPPFAAGGTFDTRSRRDGHPSDAISQARTSDTAPSSRPAEEQRHPSSVDQLPPTDNGYVGRVGNPSYISPQGEPNP